MLVPSLAVIFSLFASDGMPRSRLTGYTQFAMHLIRAVYVPQMQVRTMSPKRVQVFVRMLGYVLVRQPTVILRE